MVYLFKTLLIAASTLRDINDWPRINELYAKAFGNHRPARVVVPVKELHFGIQT